MSEKRDKLNYMSKYWKPRQFDMWKDQALPGPVIRWRQEDLKNLVIGKRIGPISGFTDLGVMPKRDTSRRRDPIPSKKLQKKIMRYK